MSEIWVWDNVYHVYRCCLGAVLLRDNKWYFYPYHSYKTGSEKWTIGPYSSQGNAKHALYDWHKRVAEFVSLLGKHEGVEMEDGYLKEQIEYIKFGFYNKSGTDILYSIHHNKTKEALGMPIWTCYHPYISFEGNYIKRAEQANKLFKKQTDEFIKFLAKHEHEGTEI